MLSRGRTLYGLAVGILMSGAIRGATGLPVFDLYTLVMQGYLATSGSEFPRELR